MGPFLEGTEEFSRLESHGKISNLMISELVYGHTLNINRGSPHTIQAHTLLHFLGTDELKMALRARKGLRGFQETGPD